MHCVINLTQKQSSFFFTEERSNSFSFARSGVLTAMLLNFRVFWYVKVCRWMKLQTFRRNVMPWRWRHYDLSKLQQILIQRRSLTCRRNLPHVRIRASKEDYDTLFEILTIFFQLPIPRINAYCPFIKPT